MVPFILRYTESTIKVLGKISSIQCDLGYLIKKFLNFYISKNSVKYWELRVVLLIFQCTKVIIKVSSNSMYLMREKHKLNYMATVGGTILSKIISGLLNFVITLGLIL